jgi:cell division protein FtsL
MDLEHFRFLLLVQDLLRATKLTILLWLAVVAAAVKKVVAAALEDIRTQQTSRLPQVTIP